jgi:4-hydroxy-3-polyprenylbenzoate decarboxylase
MWAEENKPTPVAVALGVEPGLPFVGGMPLEAGVSELDYMGAYFGEPIDTVRCETVPLEVPASSEIVIEGFISHTDTVREGPMGEFPGYLPEPEGSPKPVLRVTAVTYRNDPILPVVAAGPPVEEDHTGWGIPHAAYCLHLLRAAGLPVAGCWMVLESACHWLVVALTGDWHQRLHADSREVAQRIGDIIFASKAGFGLPKLLLVEDDIDITDLEQVVWAFATRAHPSHGEVYFSDESFSNLAVFLETSEKFAYHVTKVVHNCLLADRFPDAARPRAGSFENAWPQEIQQRVLDSWTDYGYQPA